MKFVHFADCHLDGYREEKLATLGFEYFVSVIDFALKKRVDFVVLSGDLFNTALPRIDTLKHVVEQLKRLLDASIPVYAIAGSHDFSPHGKTMLSVLEKAGLLINVMKGEVDSKGHLQLRFTIDSKTKAHITGIIGKKGMLDKEMYEGLSPLKPVKDVPNIFLFHTSITELKPKELERMNSYKISLLPPGFDYYAGGHIHIVKDFSSEKYNNVVYPGPTFPNNFSELEKLKKGSFVFFNDEEDFGGKKYKHIFIEKKKVLSFVITADANTPLQVEEKIRQAIGNTSIINAIVLFRFVGKLSEGKVQDIDFKSVFQDIYKKGAFIILKNTYDLSATLFKEVEIQEGNAQEIEKRTIAEHLNQIALPKNLDERKVIEKLLQELAVEQMDGERKSAFIERVKKITENILEK